MRSGEGPQDTTSDWLTAMWAHISPYLPPAWVWWIVIGLGVLLSARWAVRAIRRGLAALWTLISTRSTEDVLTVVAASIATAVSAQGMWRFSGDVLGLDGPLRLLLFAFIEVAIVTSAVRARRNMRQNFSAGVDGIAVWALTCLTAVLSSLDARSIAESVFRLAAPLVAAWLWERGMAIERHRIRGTGRINWRLTPERILVRVGLAEASDRTAGEVDAHRRLTRVALAAKKAKSLREQGAPERKVRGALAKLDKALDRAVEHTGLAGDKRMQWALLDEATTLYGGASLMDLADVPPWQQLDHPAITGATKHRETVELSEAIREWTASIQQQRDPETAAAITSMAAWITGRPVGSDTSTMPSGVTSPVVADLVTRQVADDVTKTVRGEVAFAPPGPPAVTPSATSAVTQPVTTNPVTKGVTVSPKSEPDEQSKTQLMRELWDEERADKRYPTVQELADHAGAHHSLASRKRGEWVTELPWYEQRRADPKRAAGA